MSILEPALAQKFIDKTAAYFEYNINIMNDKGIIIASKDASRVGDFHEVAYNMLNGTLDTGIVKENQKYLGTKLGVNLFVDYKNKHVGVIGISGNPDTVQIFADMLKTFMEAMLEYEIHMEGERRRRNKTEQFLYYLLFEENVDMSVANSMAEDLGISKDSLRVCIIIKYDLDHDPKKFVQALTDVDGYSYEDIITIARNDDIIMFKNMNIKLAEAIKDYRYIIEEYLNDFIKKLPDEYDANKFSFFIGTLQENISKYRGSYIHAQQLGLQIKEKNGIYFFNDYILEYYRKLATIKVYDNIFSVYDTLFSEEDKNQISETVEVLRKNNYNIVSSAKVLYIHRNTLLFRLNKIKDVLNIDPIANAADREFLNELAYYFNRK
ncbi:carbohydrate diacid regulator [Anaerovirgula multivorans]|uniref:Carbohydrate diacid regulator n=1 Tax=Anaerovirgula multivorans TaxID=312168 RepID=A0A239HWL4_9FIRM|nr:sugar diacid recognition domain-containing protein [Anaerovirgula multivorans]SNS85780.1 carbohydrate diacid regulator [Anaerovirgula multivorans]